MVVVGAKILLATNPKSKELGKTFLQVLTAAFPNHLPSRISNSVRVNGVFDPNRPEEFLKRWNARSLFLQGDSPHIDIFINRQISRINGKPLPRHIEIDFKPMVADPIAAQTFATDIANAFAADFAAVHIFVKQEQQMPAAKHREYLADHRVTYVGEAMRLARDLDEGLRSYGLLWSQTLERLQTTYLQRYIPDLYWFTILGPPYVRLFGRDRLLEAPAEGVQ
jgi:hypothetical protein